MRLAPNELSFIDPQAWHDIYAYAAGKPDFPKHPLWISPMANGAHSLITSNGPNHSRMRRIISNLFSDKAMREQEPILNTYIGLLIKRLHEKTDGSANGKAAVNIVDWFNYTTFDIIGDLSFGESLGCLDESRLHPWIALLFSAFKMIALDVSTRLFPGGQAIVHAILPESARKEQEDHFNLTKEKTHKRMERGEQPERKDFMTYLLRFNDEKGLSVLEIESNFSLLLIAGSETTGTALSAIILHLLQSPEVLEKLVSEIRTSFPVESAITMENIANASYLNAVIEEGLRLCPPAPNIFPRMVPDGGMVLGQPLPHGVSFCKLPCTTENDVHTNHLKQTIVAVPLYAAFRSPHMFTSPDEFLPSRWLNESNHFVSSVKGFHPFSTGTHNCIGKNLAYMEMRLVLARLLWNFDVSQDKELPKWEDQKTYMLWDKKPLNIILTARKT